MPNSVHVDFACVNAETLSIQYIVYFNMHSLLMKITLRLCCVINSYETLRRFVFDDVPGIAPSVV